MDEDKIDKVVRIAEELKAKPERWGWPITAVLYGHGKVVVQFVTPRGKTEQLVRKV